MLYLKAHFILSIIQARNLGMTCLFLSLPTSNQMCPLSHSKDLLPPLHPRAVALTQAAISVSVRCGSFCTGIPAASAHLATSISVAFLKHTSLHVTLMLGSH